MVNFVINKRIVKNISVKEIMTKEVITVSADQKLIDVKHIFEKDKFHHHIPVAEDGLLVGMISLVDFLYAIKKASLDDEEQVYHQLLVCDVMRENPEALPDTATLRDVGEELIKGNVHALVITEGKRIKGIVSTTDVIRHFIRNT